MRPAAIAIPRGLAALRRAITAEVDDVNRMIYHTLLGGTLACVVFLVAALAVLAITRAPIPTTTVAVPDIVRGVSLPSPQGMLSLGLLALIATPMARVALSVGYFTKERDRTYVLITLIVLGNLVLGLALGIA